MRLTPELLASSYDLLRQTKPFNRMALPETEDVCFRVLKSSKLFGDYFMEGDQHVIRLSQAKHTRLSAVLMTVAHEMVHLHLDEVGCSADSGRHGPQFKSIAANVCRHHPEFDPALF